MTITIEKKLANRQVVDVETPEETTGKKKIMHVETNIREGMMIMIISVILGLQEAIVIAAKVDGVMVKDVVLKMKVPVMRSDIAETEIDPVLLQIAEAQDEEMTMKIPLMIDEEIKKGTTIVMKDVVEERGRSVVKSMMKIMRELEAIGKENADQKPISKMTEKEIPSRRKENHPEVGVGMKEERWFQVTKIPRLRKSGRPPGAMQMEWLDLVIVLIETLDRPRPCPPLNWTCQI